MSSKGSFTLTIPGRVVPLPRRWWERLLCKRVRYYSDSVTTQPLSVDASAEDLQQALSFAGAPNIAVVKTDEGTFILHSVGADEVSIGADEVAAFYVS